MTARKRLTERQALEVAIRQNAVIPCFRCRIAFTEETVRKAEREHLHEKELGGGEDLSNFRWSHKDCHDAVTNGTKATTAGSSKHRIAKAKRIAGGGKKRRGQPIQSRGFPKPPEGYKHQWGKRPSQNGEHSND